MDIGKDRTMKILIIEDEQSSADRLRRMLEGEHDIVGVAQSNAEIKAFFAASHADVDLILSDEFRGTSHRAVVNPRHLHHGIRSLCRAGLSVQQHRLSAKANRC